MAPTNLRPALSDGLPVIVASKRALSATVHAAAKALQHSAG
jgi:hypothetical protein